MSAGNHSAVDATEFAAYMQALVPQPPARMAVAVSGGADSMALCLLAAEWARAHHITLHAITIDHGLRAESADEAVQVGQWLTARGITHRTLQWTGEKPQANRQEAARHARYRLLHDYCASENISHLLLAHHLNDQAETFLIRLARGSGVDGLAAMQPCSKRHGLTLLRPVLGVPKTRLIATLEAYDQPWIEDPSNHNAEYARTGIRALAPALETAGIDASDLAATASRMARARDYLEQQTAEAYRTCVTEKPEGEMLINSANLLALHPEIGLRVLADVLRRMNGHHLRPRFSELEALYQHLQHPRTLAGCLFTPANGMVRVQREAAALSDATTVVAGQTLQWDGRFLITIAKDFPLTGATIGALGEAGYAAIKPALPRGVLGRDTARLLPALWHLEKPLLVPHIGYVDASAQADWMQVMPFPKGGECY